MALTPIGAHCMRCGEDFHLGELLDDRSGRCPRCGWALTPDWTHKLLEDARRADVAQRHLVAALRSLQALPGNVTVRPHTVLRNLLEEVSWEHDLAATPSLFEEERCAIRDLLADWEVLDPTVARAQPQRGWLRRGIDLISGRRVDPVVRDPAREGRHPSPPGTGAARPGAQQTAQRGAPDRDR